MITYRLWDDFKDKLFCNKRSLSYIYDSDLAFILVLDSIITPITIALDILLIPLELLYLISYKVICKLRWGDD